MITHSLHLNLNNLIAHKINKQILTNKKFNNKQRIKRKKRNLKRKIKKSLSDFFIN